jgi:hypothetical protein
VANLAANVRDNSSEGAFVDVYDLNDVRAREVEPPSLGINRRIAPLPFAAERDGFEDLDFLAGALLGMRWSAQGHSGQKADRNRGLNKIFDIHFYFGILSFWFGVLPTSPFDQAK